MRVLALDTTTRAGSVAVLEDGRVLVERAGDASRTQTERLPRELLEALDAVSLTTADIDLFAVAAGPGSFTGLRTGIATIQGLALVHRRPVAAISVLRALAEAAAVGQPAGTCVGAWMDGHRREVFSALYQVDLPAPEHGAAVLVEREEHRVGAPADVVTRWSSLGLPSVLCGDGAAMYAALAPEGVRLCPAPLLASFIGRLAPVSAAVSAAGVRPLYVRRPDVELAREAAARLRA